MTCLELALGIGWAITVIYWSVDHVLLKSDIEDQKKIIRAIKIRCAGYGRISKGIMEK